MSFNPVRAASFYRNRGKGVRQPNNPHAGIKHSDIMKRQGVGITVPMTGREVTPHGFSAVIMESDAFTVRSEVIASGNNLGCCFNPKQDRMILVQRGSLFIQLTDDTTQESTTHRLQQGANVKIPKGLVHMIAASGTEDSEVLFVEEPNYSAGLQWLKAPELRGIAADTVFAGVTPDAATAITHRRTDQTLAKTQAASMAVKKTRRRPVKQISPTPALPGVGGERAPNAPLIAAQVQGVNPRPMGAGALGDD